LLPSALRWCRSRGADLVERVADLGPVTVDEDIFRRWRGRPGRLHVTIARTPEAAVATETVAGCPLDLTIAFDRFGLALATELPYGGLSWLYMSRGRKR
jgi:hypothetical protein